MYVARSVFHSIDWHSFKHTLQLHRSHLLFIWCQVRRSAHSCRSWVNIIAMSSRTTIFEYIISLRNKNKNIFYEPLKYHKVENRKTDKKYVDKILIYMEYSQIFSKSLKICSKHECRSVIEFFRCSTRSSTWIFFFKVLQTRMFFKYVEPIFVILQNKPKMSFEYCLHSNNNQFWGHLNFNATNVGRCEEHLLFGRARNHTNYRCCAWIKPL